MKYLAVFIYLLFFSHFTFGQSSTNSEDEVWAIAETIDEASGQITTINETTGDMKVETPIGFKMGERGNPQLFRVWEDTFHGTKQSFELRWELNPSAIPPDTKEKKIIQGREAEEIFTQLTDTDAERGIENLPGLTVFTISNDEYECSQIRNSSKVTVIIKEPIISCIHLD